MLYSHAHKCLHGPFLNRWGFIKKELDPYSFNKLLRFFKTTGFLKYPITTCKVVSSCHYKALIVQSLLTGKIVPVHSWEKISFQNAMKLFTLTIYFVNNYYYIQEWTISIAIFFKLEEVSAGDKDNHSQEAKQLCYKSNNSIKIPQKWTVSTNNLLECSTKA